MKFIILPKTNNPQEKQFLIKLNDAAIKLYKKLSEIEISTLDISEYNQQYLRQYIDNYTFYIQLYTYIIRLVGRDYNWKINNLTFVDYGGGCGIFSYLARETGFKRIIYNDIYDVSCKDVEKIAEKIGLPVDFVVCGDIARLTSFVNQKKIDIDVICSFDVLEHIYDLEYWFEKAKELNNSFSLYFTSGANSKNPWISKRLMKLHKKVEYNGTKRDKGWKERDTVKAFFDVRKDIIKKHSSSLTDSEIDLLAEKTRGLRKEDIEKNSDIYLKDKTINYTNPHPTNTCDPYTGNWAERLINFKYLIDLLKIRGYNAEILPGYYSFSKKRYVRLIKGLFNLCILMLGKKSIYIAPLYILEANLNKLISN